MIKQQETSYKQCYIENQSLSSCSVVPICSLQISATIPEIQALQPLPRICQSETTLENRQKQYICELQRKKYRDCFMIASHFQQQKQIKNLLLKKAQNGSKIEGKFALSTIDAHKLSKTYLQKAQSHFSIDHFRLPFILHPCQHLLNFFNNFLSKIDLSSIFLKACRQQMIANTERSNLLLAFPAPSQGSTFCKLWRTFSPVSIFNSCFKDVLIHRLRQTISGKHFKPIKVYQRQQWKISVSIASISFRFNQRHPPKPFSIKCVKSVLYQVQAENFSIPSNISPIRSPQIIPRSLSATLTTSTDRLPVFALPGQQEGFSLPERPEEQYEEELSNRSRVLPRECQESSIQSNEDDQ